MTASFIILFLLITGGGLLYFLLNKSNDTLLKLSLAFSGAYLFGITITHLVPEVFRQGDKSMGIYVMAGFLFQIILEYFSKGIEHGHIHVHEQKQHAMFPLSMMISLCIHAFFEGVPMAEAQQRQSLMMGIAMHHIPVAFALMSMLMNSGVSKTVSVFSLVVFAAMSPAGAIFGIYLGDTLMAEWFSKIMAIVIGIFLHISTTILFESDSNHRFNFIKMAVILAGVIFSLLV